MRIVIGFLQLISLVMATLSFAALVMLAFTQAGYQVEDYLREHAPVLRVLIGLHHLAYWNAAKFVGLIASDAFPVNSPLPFVLIHGTNVLLGFLSLRAILRTPTENGAIAVGPAISSLFSYVQQAALWTLNVVTAGVLGNYVYDTFVMPLLH